MMQKTRKRGDKILTFPSFPHNIEYKSFRINGKHAILDVKNSEFFCVEPVIADILRFARRTDTDNLMTKLQTKYTKSEIKSALIQLAKWQRQGFFQDEGRRSTLNIPPVDAVGLTLNVAGDCNLQCRYCFARHYLNDKIYMSRDTARRCVDFFLDYLGDGTRGTINFSGGEPLLNLAVIKEVVRYASLRFKKAHKKLSFQMATNGTLLNKEVIDFLRRNRFCIYISMDGPAKTQNLQRPFKSGNGSYSATIKWLPYLLKSTHERATVICVLTSLSPSISDLYKHFLNMGFVNIGLQHCFYSPEQMLNFKETDFSKVKAAYSALLREYKKTLEEGRFARLLPFDKIATKIKLYGCGFGRSLLTIDPKGEIYPCQKFQGIKEFIIGDIKNGIDPARQRYYLEHTSETSAACKNCWARYICGGGCEYLNFRLNGEKNLPVGLCCRIIKFMIKGFLTLFQSVSEDGKEVFIKAYGN